MAGREVPVLSELDMPDQQGLRKQAEGSCACAGEKTKGLRREPNKDIGLCQRDITGMTK